MSEKDAIGESSGKEKAARVEPKALENSPSATPLKQDANKTKHVPQKKVPQARPRNTIRRELISNTVGMVQGKNLSGVELLEVVKGLGLTVLFNRYRGQDGAWIIRFTDNLGPLEPLVQLIANTINRGNYLRQLITRGAPVKDGDFELLKGLNAEGYDENGNQITPGFYQPIQKSCQELLKKINIRIKDIEKAGKEAFETRRTKKTRGSQKRDVQDKNDVSVAPAPERSAEAAAVGE